MYINKTIGAIFCHVNIIVEFHHLKPSRTSGNQKWNGVIPIFNKNLEFIIKAGNSLISFLERLDSHINIIIEIIIAVDAITWEKKYLIIDSEEVLFFWLISKGIIDITLISKPIHTPIHEYDLIEIIVLEINIEKNNNL